MTRAKVPQIKRKKGKREELHLLKAKEVGMEPINLKLTIKTEARTLQETFPPILQPPWIVVLLYQMIQISYLYLFSQNSYKIDRFLNQFQGPLKSHLEQLVETCKIKGENSNENKILAFLLKYASYGANNISDIIKTAIDYGEKEAGVASVKFLLEQQGETITPDCLKEALDKTATSFDKKKREGAAKIARLLKDKGISSPSSSELNDWLYSAIDYGYIEGIWILIDSGADVTYTKYGETLLDIAEKRKQDTLYEDKNYDKIATVLKNHNAQTSTTSDPSGQSTAIKDALLDKIKDTQLKNHIQAFFKGPETTENKKVRKLFKECLSRQDKVENMAEFVSELLDDFFSKPKTKYKSIEYLLQQPNLSSETLASLSKPLGIVIEELFSAIYFKESKKKDSYKRITELLKNKGVKLDQTEANELLLKAVSEIVPDLIPILIALGANPNHEKNGKRLLTIAKKNRRNHSKGNRKTRKRVVEELIKAGAEELPKDINQGSDANDDFADDPFDPNESRSARTSTPHKKLLQTVREGNVQEVLKLAEQNPESIYVDVLFNSMNDPAMYEGVINILLEKKGVEKVAELIRRSFIYLSESEGNEKKLELLTTTPSLKYLDKTGVDGLFIRTFYLYIVAPYFGGGINAVWAINILKNLKERQNIVQFENLSEEAMEYLRRLYLEDVGKDAQQLHEYMLGVCPTYETYVIEQNRLRQEAQQEFEDRQQSTSTPKSGMTIKQATDEIETICKRLWKTHLNNHTGDDYKKEIDRITTLLRGFKGDKDLHKLQVETYTALLIIIRIAISKRKKRSADVGWYTSFINYALNLNQHLGENKIEEGGLNTGG